jgi:hypothetical protein
MEDVKGAGDTTGVVDMMTGVKGTTTAEKKAETTKDSIRNEVKEKE